MKTVVEHLLADRALRAIECGEHGVEIQVLPRPVVERAGRVAMRDLTSVVLADRTHVARADLGFAPFQAEAGEGRSSSVPAKAGDEQGNERRRYREKCGIQRFCSAVRG
jgi:hypothetical protein